MIGRQVGVLEDRGELVLAGRNLIVAGLDWDSQLDQLGLGLGHAGQHALGDAAEVLVFQLLALGRLGAEQGSTGIDQVGTSVIEIPVDQEILLFRADGREDLLGFRIAEQPQDAQGLSREGLHRAQQGGLLVERFAGPAEKHGGDDQRGTVGAFVQEGGAGRVPGGVAACLEGRPDRERAGVGFAADQFLAAELGDGHAVRRRLQKAIVLLGGQAGHRLKQVSEVRGPLLHRPVFHSRGNAVGDGRVQGSALLDGVLQRPKDRLGQSLSLDFLIEDVGAIQVLDVRGLEVHVIELVLGPSDGSDGLLPNSC